MNGITPRMAMRKTTAAEMRKARREMMAEGRSPEEIRYAVWNVIYAKERTTMSFRWIRRQRAAQKAKWSIPEPKRS